MRNSPESISRHIRSIFAEYSMEYLHDILANYVSLRPIVNKKDNPINKLPLYAPEHTSNIDPSPPNHQFPVPLVNKIILMMAYL